MKIFLKILICLILIGVKYNLLYSQSIYSTVGLGELYYFINTRSAGMGHIGLAIGDDISHNRLNPACSANLKDTAFNTGFILGGVRISQKGNTFSSSLSRFNGASLSIKIVDGFLITVGMFPFSDYEYEFYSYEKDLKYSTGLVGNGGLTSGSGGVALKLSKKLALGISINRLFGRLEERTIIDFYDVNYTDTKDDIDKILYGNYFNYGFAYEINNKTKIGGFFSTGSKLKGRIEYNHIYGFSGESQKINVNLPYSFGLGGIYQLNQKIILGSDIFIFNGSQMKYNDSVIDFVKNAYKIGFGGEITPSKNLYDEYIKRMSYRWGFFINSPYIKYVNNASIKEYFLTGGLGLPFSNDLARIDIALEIGMRSSGNNDSPSEKVIKLSLGFGSLEKWFSREKK